MKIKNDMTIHKLVGEIIELMIDQNISFPLEILYRKTPKMPLCRIWIGKADSDFFADEKGQKWIKSNS